VADHVSEGLLGGMEPSELFDLAMAHPAADLMRMSRGGLLASFESLCEHREHLVDLD